MVNAVNGTWNPRGGGGEAKVALHSGQTSEICKS